MTAHVHHSCRCGQTKLKIAVPARSAGTHVRCYCVDCQTAANLYDNADDVLTPAGGTDIWQTTPDQIQITAGQEHLKILRLSPKGLLRWHAGCCNTPVMNTLPNLKIPFVGTVLRQSQRAQHEAVYGPAICEAYTASARPGQRTPGKDRGFKRAGAAVLRRMFLALVSGRAKHNPLRGPDGAPIAPIEVISRETRAAARPDHL
ncbi:MAG: DUF6151 family protein [Roseovarius sp.]